MRLLTDAGLAGAAAAGGELYDEHAVITGSMTQNYCDLSAYLDLFTERLAVYGEEAWESWFRRRSVSMPR